MKAWTFDWHDDGKLHVKVDTTQATAAVMEAIAEAPVTTREPAVELGHRPRSSMRNLVAFAVAGILGALLVVVQDVFALSDRAALIVALVVSAVFVSIALPLVRQR
jgi:VIT1/CCC1 family predicted Fe2+/Mn2+ transporter